MSAGCVDCGRPVDRTIPDPVPEGYECMWSEAMTGRALYCLACYESVPPVGGDESRNGDSEPVTEARSDEQGSVRAVGPNEGDETL